MPEQVVHVNTEGRRYYRVTLTTPAGPVLNLIAQAASEDEVRTWLQSQIGSATDDATITDVGHTDRTEVTAWGLTDRL